MNLITERLPKQVQNGIDLVPHLNYLLEVPGVYLAGGLLRSIVSDMDFSDKDTDIDLFFENPQVLSDVKFWLETYTDYEKVFQCPENKLATYKSKETKWKLQCISVEYYQDVPTLINSFDFTCIVIGTDGENIWYGDTTIADIDAKHLRWNTITYPASTLRRMMKYAKKGYHMIESDYQFFCDKLWNRDPNVVDVQLVYVD